MVEVYVDLNAKSSWLCLLLLMCGGEITEITHLIIARKVPLSVSAWISASVECQFGLVLKQWRFISQVCVGWVVCGQMVRLCSFPCPTERRRGSGEAPSRACPHSLGSRATKTPSSGFCVCVACVVMCITGCVCLYMCVCVRVFACALIWPSFTIKPSAPSVLLHGKHQLDNMNNMFVYVGSSCERRGAQELVRLMTMPYVHCCL